MKVEPFPGYSVPTPLPSPPRPSSRDSRFFSGPFLSASFATTNVSLVGSVGRSPIGGSRAPLFRTYPSFSPNGSQNGSFYRWEEPTRPPPLLRGPPFSHSKGKVLMGEIPRTIVLPPFFVAAPRPLFFSESEFWENLFFHLLFTSNSFFLFFFPKTPYPRFPSRSCGSFRVSPSVRMFFLLSPSSAAAPPLGRFHA